MPFRESIQTWDGQELNQIFTSFCYMENQEQTIVCTNIGDIMVIEQIEVVQVIDQSEFIEPGTEVGSRLNFKRVIPCQFGFAAFTNDIVYFFEFRDSAAEIAKKKQKSGGTDVKGSKMTV